MEQSTGILWRVWDYDWKIEYVQADSLDDAKRIFESTYGRMAVGFQPV